MFQLLKRGNDMYLSWLDFLNSINKGMSVAKCLSYSRNAECILRQGGGSSISSIKYPRNSRSQSPRVENVLVNLFSHKTTNSITTDLMSPSLLTFHLCHGLRVPRFTMVFGKFFAFFRNQKVLSDRTDHGTCTLGIIFLIKLFNKAICRASPWWTDSS